MIIGLSGWRIHQPDPFTVDWIKRDTNAEIRAELARRSLADRRPMARIDDPIDRHIRKTEGFVRVTLDLPTQEANQPDDSVAAGCGDFEPISRDAVERFMAKAIYPIGNDEDHEASDASLKLLEYLFGITPCTPLSPVVENDA